MVGNISLAGLDVSLGAVLLCSLPASICTCNWKAEKVLGLFGNIQNIIDSSHSFHTNSKTQPAYWKGNINSVLEKGMGSSVCSHIIHMLNPEWKTVITTKKKIFQLLWRKLTWSKQNHHTQSIFLTSGMIWFRDCLNQGPIEGCVCVIATCEPIFHVFLLSLFDAIHYFGLLRYPFGSQFA